MNTTAGFLVLGSNSVLLAPALPSTLRANSTTAICMPRQMPRYGTCEGKHAHTHTHVKVKLGRKRGWEEERLRDTWQLGVVARSPRGSSSWHANPAPHHVRPGVLGSQDLPFDASVAKPTRDQDPVCLLELLPGRFVLFGVLLLALWLEVGGLDPLNLRSGRSGSKGARVGRGQSNDNEEGLSLIHI